MKALFNRLLAWWPVLILVGAGLVAITLFAPIFGRPLISLVQNQKTAASVDVLTEMRDLLQFTSVQYVYKVVFPFDFMKPGISMEGIAKKIGGNYVDLPKNLLALTTKPETILSGDELLFVQTKALCDQLGLRYQKPDFQFLLVTVIVEAGFDLSGTALDQPQKASSDFRDQTFQIQTIREGEPGPVGGRRAILRLPPAKLSEVRIEDRDTNPADQAVQSALPRVEITPSQWQAIATFIENYYAKRPIQEGILKDATNNAKTFVAGLLTSLGYDEARVETTEAEVKK